ncbi:MAG TPA: PAS domain S-box protein, partial [Chloroflexota bacterium]
MTFSTVASGPGPWQCPILAVQLRQILEAACSFGAERASLTDADGQLRAWAGKGGDRGQSEPGDRRIEARAAVRVGGAAVAEVLLAGLAHRHQRLARLAEMTATRLAEAWAAAQDVESLSNELLRTYEELHLLYQFSEALTGQLSVVAAGKLLLEKLLDGLRASRAELFLGEPPVAFQVVTDPYRSIGGAEPASDGHTLRTVLRSAGAVVGSIVLGRSARDVPFSSADGKLLDAVGALAANALRASGEREAYLRAILENVADGIVTLDERGVVESCEGAVERIFGFAAAEVVGRPFHLLLAAPTDAAAGDAIVGWLREGVQAAPREVAGRRKD